jgi:hypothetical protein
MSTQTTFQLVNKDVARKLNNAAKAMLAARETLYEVTESSFYTEEEKATAQQYALMIIDLSSKVSRLASFNMTEITASWTGKKE